ncbi:MULTISPECIES: ABC transporter permease [Brevibacillus]|jgi:peptide/nickel transport system permease protein|uniref:ABC transporter permease n=1 Tax=Brevibacillus TaxID=55080 RepID=UPI000468B5E3|nr:ABC transporter permease [Brevibacillus borstelensis]KKX57171.1 ABC transporter permease [Brevibacillus borstelensis cifa_chp40]MCC0567141.1 ABC transporter permease [Brevibacillus borstelensis]MCM3561594.1 ABC transporter permease [Brevibacillus borstelensis]MCM3625434.1 ABC transporter permease [Brevibacillus borstelensis]MED1854671.1 ABC transporter permease [Brevibacillus borstelensis]
MGLVPFILKKLLRMAALLIALCILSFWLVSYSPLDPVQAYVGADMTRVSSEQREMIAEYWGLNKPPLERFLHWGSAVLHGDLGTSMIFRRPVAEVIGERFMASLALMSTAWLLSGVLGFALGAVAGMKQGTWADRLIKWYCFTLASTPAFWLGLLLVMVFAVWLGWFPVGLGVPAGKLADDVTLANRIYHLILPALTLSILGVANVALHTRQKLVDVLASDYILFARARGEKGLQLFWRHGLRNVALPAISIQFASISELIGGTVLAEQVFSYPGLGQATVQAGLRSDVPLLLGIVIFSALLVFVGNLAADIIYRVVDPRIRKGESA